MSESHRRATKTFKGQNSWLSGKHDVTHMSVYFCSTWGSVSTAHFCRRSRGQQFYSGNMQVNNWQQCTFQQEDVCTRREARPWPPLFRVISGTVAGAQHPEAATGCRASRPGPVPCPGPHGRLTLMPRDTCSSAALPATWS